MFSPEAKSVNNNNLSRPVKALRNNAIINVKIAEPITAHTTGKGLPSIEIEKISGKPNLPAIHKPIYAAIKPTIIDTRHPPSHNLPVIVLLNRILQLLARELKILLET